MSDQYLYFDLGIKLLFFLYLAIEHYILMLMVIFIVE